MKKGRITFTPKTRKDISNPHHKFSHEENLLKADVKKIVNYLIIDLPNGRIKIKPLDE